MLGIFIKLFLATLKDAFFCTCLLFLCFNPYSGLSEISRILTTFFGFIFYLLLPRIIKYSTYEPLIKTVDYNRISEQKDTFIAALSHDIKSPVVSQIASLNMLLRGDWGKLNKEQEEITKTHINSCNFILRMAFTLLATYQFEKGQTVLNIKQFDIIKMVESTVDELKSLAKENSQFFEIKFETSPSPLIWADEIQLKRVVMNLISNAVNYGFRNTKIKITGFVKEGCLRFYIESKSPHIPDEKLELLFRKFSSPYFKNPKSGTGLGLYLSKKIIEAHGGNIMAESLENNTNIFGFIIPADNSEEANEIRKKYGRVLYE